jgi:hypothetical protein
MARGGTGSSRLLPGGQQVVGRFGSHRTILANGLDRELIPFDDVVRNQPNRFACLIEECLIEDWFALLRGVLPSVDTYCPTATPQVNCNLYNYENYWFNPINTKDKFPANELR